MPAVAIDVVVLLPTHTRVAVERVHAPLDVVAGSGFRFDITQYSHITLGQHFVNADQFTFVPRAIAVCHLGRFCTVGDRLANWTL